MTDQMPVTDDLVTRLRHHAWGGYCHKPTLKEAADRIEELEAERDEALRKEVKGEGT